MDISLSVFLLQVFIHVYLLYYFRWALANIAGDCVELKDLLLHQGILTKVLFVCQLQYDEKWNTNFDETKDIDGSPMFITMLSTTSWCINNLCRGSPPPTMQHLELILKCIIALMKHEINLNQNKRGKMIYLIDEILSNCALAAENLLFYDDYTFVNAIDYIIETLDDAGVIKQFIELIDCDNKNVRHSCNRVIGNIMTGTDEHTSKCVELGVLTKYHNVLTNYCVLPLNQDSANTPNTKTKIVGINRERKEIIWSISNIAAGPLDHKLLILKHGLFPIVCRYLMYGEKDVQREAIWAITNATLHSNRIITDSLVNQCNVIECLTSFLVDYNGMKQNTLMVAIESIRNILECGDDYLCDGKKNPYLDKFEEHGLLKLLVDLTTDEDLDEVIFEKVSDILNKHWNGKKGNDEDTLGYELDQAKEEYVPKQNEIKKRMMIDMSMVIFCHDSLRMIQSVSKRKV